VSYSLNNQPTADVFPTSTGPVLLCPGTVRLRVHIDNAGVLWQFAEADPTPRWGEHPEATLLPGVYSLDQSCDAVRFRSLAAGKPAQVSVQALVEGE
jgi:hypothetical protein